MSAHTFPSFTIFLIHFSTIAFSFELLQCVPYQPPLSCLRNTVRLLSAGNAAHLAIALLKQATILKTTLLNTYKSMQTYEEILTMVQKLNLDDRFRLLEDLRLLIYEPVMVIGTDEVIPAEVIAESDAALQDYQAGRDLGLASAALKKKLFGQNVD